MRLSIRSLQYFLGAAEHGSIVHAAREMNVAASAISNAIDQVEAEFGLNLVQRYPAKGIRPTATGMVMMRKIRSFIEEYDNLLTEGSELRTALSGNISVGYYAPMAPAFMPAIVEPLTRGNPDVKMNFVECDNERAQTGLLNGAFDVIVFVAENVRAGIEYETLIEAPPYLLVPFGHALANNKSVEFADMEGLPQILLDLPFTSEYYRSLLDEHSIGARIAATASTTEMVRSLVGAGTGCAILNMVPLTDTSYAGHRVVAIPIRSHARPLKLVLGHVGGNRRRLVQAFMDACRDYFSEPAANDLVVACGPGLRGGRRPATV